jgi:hypothetical protein
MMNRTQEDDFVHNQCSSHAKLHITKVHVYGEFTTFHPAMEEKYFEHTDTGHGQLPHARVLIVGAR